MKDLISREAVIERIKYEADVCNSGITKGVLKFLQAIVENMPSAVDAVEVVRCRDCKHNDDCIRRIEFVGRNLVLELNTYEYHPLDFCSYGERKE